MIKRIILVFVAILVLFLSYLVFKTLTTSTVVLTINPTVSPLNTTVIIDGVLVKPSGTGGTQYIAKVGMGDHLLTVVSAGYMDAEVKIKTTLRSTKKLEVNLDGTTAEDAARSIVAGDENIEILKPQLFGDGQWLVFLIRGTGQDSETSVAIAQFNTMENKWNIVDEGTDIDLSSAQYLFAPSDLIIYVESLYR